MILDMQLRQRTLDLICKLQADNLARDVHLTARVIRDGWVGYSHMTDIELMRSLDSFAKGGNWEAQNLMSTIQAERILLGDYE